METTTTAGAGVMITTPMWLSTINPYLQTVAVVMGIAWIAMQMYFKIKDRKKTRDEET